MKALKYIYAVAFLTMLSFSGYSQCENEMNVCNNNFTNDYISDGQIYRALLDGEQTAEFDVTLFGGSTYRISAISGDKEGNIIFRLLDQEGNVLFNNADYSNASYWDFTLDSTLDCTIEAQLDVNKRDSGCGVLLIGFKK